MNTIIIVLPILFILMYELGLNLNIKDFRSFSARPLPVIVGLVGQIIILPLIAFGVGKLFNLPDIFFIGIMLIACCPGGSSSNIFSLLAGGDIALSVLLTSLSSIINLLSIPIILSLSIAHVNFSGNATLELPIVQLIIQNIVLMLLPILLGVICRRYFPIFSENTNKILSKFSFPALLLLATIFFIQHYDTIVKEFTTLGTCITVFIIAAILISSLLASISKLKRSEKRTITIEVGMQNAASAIAIGSSPFIFNNDMIAIPAIIYALVMNVVLLSYLQIIKFKK